MAGGATLVSFSIGIVSSGTTTVDCGKGPNQWMVNTGASTIAAPANDGDCGIQVINGNGAGAITLTGFPTQPTGTGDTFATANTASGTGTFTNGSANIGLTNTLVAGQPVYLTTSGGLPTNYTANTVYYVSATSLSTSNIQVAATPGGTPIIAGSAGSGTQTVHVPICLSSDHQPPKRIGHCFMEATAVKMASIVLGFLRAALIAAQVFFAAPAWSQAGPLPGMGPFILSSSGPTVGNIGAASDNVGTTVRDNWHANVPAGALIVVGIFDTDAVGIAGSVADSGGVNTYTRINGQNSGSLGQWTEYYVANAAALSGGTITYTKGAAGPACVAALYITGAALSSPNDSAVTANATGRQRNIG